MGTPLSKGRVENLRRGRPFWEYLADYDIPATIFKMPGNFPCKSEKVKMVSGMGTPDLRGGYGSFTLFTTSSQYSNREISGGMVVPVQFRNNFAELRLSGPENSLRRDIQKRLFPSRYGGIKNIMS